MHDRRHFQLEMLLAKINTRAARSAPTTGNLDPSARQLTIWKGAFQHAITYWAK
jgi:hypothetical protein